MASGSSLSISKSSDGTYLHDCDVCKYMYNKTSEGVSFCTNCKEYLCDECDRTHKILKGLRGHKIVTGKNMPSTSQVGKPLLPIMYCENHKSMTLNGYCVTHGDVICGTCKLTDHRKCNTTDVTQQTKGMKIQDELEQTIKRLNDLKKNCEKIKTSRQGDKSKVTSEKKGCIDDVKKLRNRMNNLFDQLEKALTKEATDMEEDMITEIDNHVTIMDDALNQIKAQVISLDQCRKSKSNDVMFVGMRKAAALQKKYEVAISNIEQEIYPIQMEFQPNDVISDALLPLQSLGSIKTRKHYSPQVPNEPVETKADQLSSRPTDTAKAGTDSEKGMSTDTKRTKPDLTYASGKMDRLDTTYAERLRAEVHQRVLSRAKKEYPRVLPVAYRPRTKSPECQDTYSPTSRHSRTSAYSRYF